MDITLIIYLLYYFYKISNIFLTHNILFIYVAIIYPNNFIFLLFMHLFCHCCCSHRSHHKKKKKSFLLFKFNFMWFSVWYPTNNRHSVCHKNFHSVVPPHAPFSFVFGFAGTSECFFSFCFKVFMALNKKIHRNRY